MVKTSPDVEPEAPACAVGGSRTTRDALAAPLRLGSIRARGADAAWRERVRPPLPHTPGASGSRVAEPQHDVEDRTRGRGRPRSATTWPPRFRVRGERRRRARSGRVPTPAADRRRPIVIPGEYVLGEGEIVANQGRRTVELTVSNTADRPIQIGSHFHFFEVNRALRFDRAQAFGMRLNVPAGTAVRFEPGDEKRVTLVEVGGLRQLFGLNALTEGGGREQALAKLAA